MVSIGSKFKTLIRDLDPESFEDLRRLVDDEVEQRRSETAFQMESINTRMTAEERHQAAREIARVLKERS
jgi:hypothetical protein